MMFVEPSEKKTLFASHGIDQLGNAVGSAQPGDIVKVHMKASYVAEEPLFKFFGRKQLRTKEFLSTHIIGDTAFYDFHIPIAIASKSPSKPKCASDILRESCVMGMALGERAKFIFDLTTMGEKNKSLFFNLNEKKLHRGQYRTIPADAKRLIFEIESFRVVRNKELHVRPNRYGTGARTPGSFSM